MTATEPQTETANALARREDEPGQQQLAPRLTPQDIAGNVHDIQELIREVMVEGVHYGTIPGCGQEKHLLKPGIELLMTMFQFAPRFRMETAELGDDHIEIVATCSLHHIGTGRFVGEGIGSCSTREKKYAYRVTDETTGVAVPKDYWDAKNAGNFKAAQEILRRAMSGDGTTKFYASKIDGNWQICVKTRVPNPEIADCRNTVRKMAQKRAAAAAIRAATGAAGVIGEDPEEREEVAGQEEEIRETEIVTEQRPTPQADDGARRRAAGGRLRQALQDAGKTFSDLMNRLREVAPQVHALADGRSIEDLPEASWQPIAGILQDWKRTAAGEPHEPHVVPVNEDGYEPITENAIPF